MRQVFKASGHGRGARATRKEDLRVSNVVDLKGKLVEPEQTLEEKLSDALLMLEESVENLRRVAIEAPGMIR